MSTDLHNALSALKVFEQQYRGLLELAPLLKSAADVDKFRKEVEFKKTQAEAELKTVNASLTAKNSELAAATANINTANKKAVQIVAEAAAASAKEAAKAADVLKLAHANAEVIKGNAAAFAAARENETKNYQAAVDADLKAASTKLADKLAACTQADARLAEVNAEVERIKRLFK